MRQKAKYLHLWHQWVQRARNRHHLKPKTHSFRSYRLILASSSVLSLLFLFTLCPVSPCIICPSRWTDIMDKCPPVRCLWYNVPRALCYTHSSIELGDLLPVAQSIPSGFKCLTGVARNANFVLFEFTGCGFYWWRKFAPNGCHSWWGDLTTKLFLKS